MTTSNLEIAIPAIRSVVVSDSAATFEVEDGRSLSVPLDWYPRLSAGTRAERDHWELIGAGYGVHWPDLDEDISIEGVIQGRRSQESDKSLRAWLDRRGASRTQDA